MTETERTEETDRLDREVRALLNGHPDFRLLRRVSVPDVYSQPSPDAAVRRGVFVDVETTSLDTRMCKVIELSILPFEYTTEGQLLSVRKVDALSCLNDPGEPIPAEIRDLTGISDEMVKGQSIDPAKVIHAADQADLVIAHNASFDRPIMERYWPIFIDKPWACTARDVPWRRAGIRTGKLDYLAFQFDAFFEGHRAIEDCLAGIYILAQRFPGGEHSVLSEVLKSARRTTYRIRAIDAPFDKKDLLKNNGYRWNGGEDGKPRAWWTEISEEDLAAEKAWLVDEIYGHRFDIPAEQVTARDRYSART